LNQQVRRSFWLYAALLLVLFLLLRSLHAGATTTVVTYSEMTQLFREEKVSSFMVKDNTVTMNLKEEYEGRTAAVCGITSAEIFYEDMNELVQQQRQTGVLTSYSYEKDSPTPWWKVIGVPLATTVPIAVLFYLLILRQQGGGGGGLANFGKARTISGEDLKSKVTFADVAGAKEEKEELMEVVDFLKNPAKYQDLGAHIPKGILLVGPPGTGKTLLAKAVAGEAGVPFLSISGSDFVEMYVGVGASRVRDLFAEAEKETPAIVFIDEIDAVGRQRGTGLGGGHDEREQTLNQLLVEMDGFEGNSGVIVMAATNRADILDPALLRPGRFDHQVYVGYPDIAGREEILRVHSRKKPLAEDVQLKELAKATVGFTGADLENLMNEGALTAARHNRPCIEMRDLESSVIRLIAGLEKKSQVVTEQARRLTAYHEAGHAVVMKLLPTHDPVHQITIVPRGQAGGMTISLPQEDRAFRSKTELFEDIVALLGGRAAEALVLGDISTGAANDLDRATATARSMVARYGMSEALGNVVYDDHKGEVFIGRSMAAAKPYSEEVAALIDAEVKALMDRAYGQCLELLKAHRAQLEEVAQYLLQHETMEGETFEQVFRSAEAQA
jgi:cell division protease FtsH